MYEIREDAEDATDLLIRDSRLGAALSRCLKEHVAVLLRGHGSTVVGEGPGRHGPGNNLLIFIVDPDGNWIEISAELEVVHDRPVKVWPHAERTVNLWGRGILRA